MGQKPCPTFFMPSARSRLLKVPETCPGRDRLEDFLRVQSSSWAEQTAKLQAWAVVITLTPKWPHGPVFFDVDWSESKPSCIWDAKNADNICLLVSDWWGIWANCCFWQILKTTDKCWGTYRRCLEEDSTTWWCPLVGKQTPFPLTLMCCWLKEEDVLMSVPPRRYF